MASMIPCGGHVVAVGDWLSNTQLKEERCSGLQAVQNRAGPDANEFPVIEATVIEYFLAGRLRLRIRSG